ncbi:hypothetical protein [Streptomyces sp. MAI_2237]
MFSLVQDTLVAPRGQIACSLSQSMVKGRLAEAGTGLDLGSKTPDGVLQQIWAICWSTTRCGN